MFSASCIQVAGEVPSLSLLEATKESCSQNIARRRQEDPPSRGKEPCHAALVLPALTVDKSDETNATAINVGVGNFTFADLSWHCSAGTTETELLTSVLSR